METLLVTSPRMIPTAALARVYSPFKHSPWFTAPIESDDVEAALAREDFASEREEFSILSHPTYEYHVRRIAYFVANPPREPIDIVRTVVGGHALEDGYHRLAAAIYCGNPTIAANFGGDDEAYEGWINAMVSDGDLD